MPLISLALTLLTSFSVMAAKNHKAAKNQSPPQESTRVLAEREIQVKLRNAQPPTPQIMLPLKEDYQPLTPRSWLWSFAAQISSRRLNVSSPSDSLSRTDLSNQPPAGFLGFSAGAHWPIGMHRLGMNLAFAASGIDYDVTTPTGKLVAGQAQWISYGAQAVWSRSWLSWLGTSVKYDIAMVTASQSSKFDSRLAWTRGFTEQGPRLSLDFLFGYANRQSISAGYAIMQSPFGTTPFWSADYGVKW